MGVISVSNIANCIVVQIYDTYSPRRQNLSKIENTEDQFEQKDNSNGTICLFDDTMELEGQHTHYKHDLSIEQKILVNIVPEEEKRVPEEGQYTSPEEEIDSTEGEMQAYPIATIKQPSEAQPQTSLLTTHKIHPIQYKFQLKGQT